MRPIHRLEHGMDDALDGRVGLRRDLRQRLQIGPIHLDRQKANAISASLPEAPRATRPSGGGWLPRRQGSEGIGKQTVEAWLHRILVPCLNSRRTGNPQRVAPSP